MIPFDSNTLVNNFFERAEPKIEHQGLSIVKRTRLIEIAKPLTSRFLRKTLLYVRVLFFLLNRKNKTTYLPRNILFLFLLWSWRFLKFYKFLQNFFKVKEDEIDFVISERFFRFVLAANVKKLRFSHSRDTVLRNGVWVV